MAYTFGRRPHALGYNSNQWTPRIYGYMERQRTYQQGAWGSAEATSGVEEVVAAFRQGGARAGLRAARARRLVSGAEMYMAVRAETEEQLSARLATLRAGLAQRFNPIDAQRAAFVAARLQEVQTAVKAGVTPPQAVVDKPELPRKEVPRWLSFAAIGLSVVALLRSR